MKKILVTGHRGLVGRHLVTHLEQSGYFVKGIDIADQSGDITHPETLSRAIDGADGIVHLAAISRVALAENNPELCWLTNAETSSALLDLAAASPNNPWVLLASSREVYGEPEVLPVSENIQLRPVNIYGRAKHHMEKVAIEIRKAGLNTAIVRLANVYGCIDDHHDRVLPAFCRQAALGDELRVDGFDHLFDFTHISDTVMGIVRMIEMLDMGEHQLPPVHLSMGIGTTLRKAAELAISSAGAGARMYEAPSRNYDVCRFIGNPERAKSLLGWEAKVLPEQGIAMLVEAFMSQNKLSALYENC